MVLGELSPREAATLRREVEKDPALQQTMAELQVAVDVLTDSTKPMRAVLDPARRDVVLRAARDASAAVVPIDQSNMIRIWLPRLAVAAAVVAMIGLGLRVLRHDQAPIVSAVQPDHASESETLPIEVAMLPAPGPPDATKDEPIEPRIRVMNASALAKAEAARTTALNQKGDQFFKRVAECVSQAPIPKDDDFPKLRARGEVAAASQPALPLPVQAGVSSMIWINRTIREEHKLPALDAVRIEEMLNHFALRPVGCAALAQGVSVSAETITCPWKPSAVLLLVSFRGASDAAREVKASFVANAANVRYYRLLGFSSVSELAPPPLPTRLGAGTVTSLAIEINPATATKAIGSIEWSVDGKPSPSLALLRTDDAEPSDDARFAALVCTFGQWLINRPAGGIDREMLAALTRETFSNTLPAERLDFINLIDQSLKL